MFWVGFFWVSGFGILTGAWSFGFGEGGWGLGSAFDLWCGVVWSLFGPSKWNFMETSRRTKCNVFLCRRFRFRVLIV